MDSEALIARVLATSADGWPACYQQVLEQLCDGSSDAVFELAQQVKLQGVDVRLQTELGAAKRLADFLWGLGTSVGLPRVEALGLLAQGDAARMDGATAEAMDLLERAGTRFLVAGDRVGWARARGGWLIAATQAGSVTPADLAAMDEVRQVLREHAPAYRLAMVEQNIAIAHLYLGQHDTALVMLERALADLGPVGPDTAHHEQNLRAMLLGNQANVLLWRGDLAGARDHYMRARVLFLAIGNGGHAALAEMNLAVVERLRWNLRDALAHARAGADGLRAAGLEALAPLAGVYQADILVQLNRAAEAAPVIDDAVDALRGRGLPLDLADALCTRARTLEWAGDTDGALASLVEAEGVLTRTPSRHVSFPIVLDRAAILLAHGRASEAREVALPLLRQEVTELTGAQRARAQALAAEAALALGDTQVAQAMAMPLTADAAVGMVEAPEPRYRAHLVLARAARREDDLAAALSHYDGMTDALQLAIGELADDQRAAFLEDKDALYMEALLSALDAGAPALALGYLERWRARAIWTVHTAVSVGMQSTRGRRSRRRTAAAMENTVTAGHAPEEELDVLRTRHRATSASLAVLSADAPLRAGLTRELGELARQIRDLLATLARRAATLAPFDGAALAQALPSDATALAYALAGDDLVIFALSAGELAARRVPEGVRRLQAVSHAIHLTIDTTTARLRSLSAGDSAGVASTLERWDAPLREALQALWALLLAPVADLLPPDGAPLTLVPQGLLHALPLAAALDGDRDMYLAKRWRVRMIPTCRSLITPSAPLPPAEALAGGPPLALGYSDHGSLPRAPEEARAVAALLGGKAYVEDDARGERLQQGGAPTVVHLAAHGALRLDHPYSSFVQLADGPFHPTDALTLDLRGCRLVTLSACETGLGRASGGDEQIGLVRAFGYAGAGAVLATLWRVAEEASLAFMERFYRRAAAGASFEAALRDAQMSFIHGADNPRWAHPYFWASFQLTTHVAAPEVTAPALVSDDA
jgi:CHAT domain-containing protein